MGKFLNGVFVGVGIGLFIAPRTGEETRRMIREHVVALRKNILSEDQQHFSIDAHPQQMPPLTAEPAQPATEFFSETREQETPGPPVAQLATEFSSEPQEQETVKVPSAQPTREFFCVPQVYETPSVPPAQAATEFLSEPQEQSITSTPPADITSTLSNQNADMTGNPGNSADASKATNQNSMGFVSEEKPDKQNPTETPETDTVITEKLPPLSSPSSVPGRTVRRKTSTRTPNTGKSRGHSRS